MSGQEMSGWKMSDQKMSRQEKAVRDRGCTEWNHVKGHSSMSISDSNLRQQDFQLFFPHLPTHSGLRRLNNR